MKNFWAGFEKQAAGGAALIGGLRGAAAGAIKGVRNLGTQAIAKGSAMAATNPNLSKGLNTAGNFIRKNPKASMGIAAGTAAVGASALSSGNKEK